MRSVWAIAAELAIVVAVVAVGAEDAGPRGAPDGWPLNVNMFRRLGCESGLVRS